jgi:oligoendopeptidase F
MNHLLLGEKMEMTTDQIITWKKTSLKETDKAKATIMSFKKKGHPILKKDGSPMEHFDPTLEEVIIKAAKIIDNHVMRVLCQEGDDLIVWNINNFKQITDAKKTFEDNLKKDYKAYSVDSEGNRGKEIEEFDVEAEEIILVPPTCKG